jgi:hypothetical protein
MGLNLSVLVVRGWDNVRNGWKKDINARDLERLLCASSGHFRTFHSFPKADVRTPDHDKGPHHL